PDGREKPSPTQGSPSKSISKTLSSELLQGNPERVGRINHLVFITKHDSIRSGLPDQSTRISDG
ncbi:hypothetical protein NKW43_04270, partial [Gluconobacter albidus]|uniref:hypothetical protein n=1 Tax=Gluconobacter albidus TaxID=318683 RepID=UPI00209D797B